jgi:hypothetical protein
MPPARQRLDPGDPPRIDARLRLEQDVDLVALDREMQVDGERIDRRRMLGSGDADRRAVAGLCRHQCLRRTVQQAGGIVARRTLRKAPATAQHRLSPSDRNGSRQGAIQRAGEADQRARLRHRRNDDIAAARRADHRIVTQQVGGHRTDLPMGLGDQRIAHRAPPRGIQNIEPRQRDPDDADLPPGFEPGRNRFADIFRIGAQSERRAAPLALMAGRVPRRKAQRELDVGRIARLAQEMGGARGVELVERIAVVGQHQQRGAGRGDQAAQRAHRRQTGRGRLSPIDQDHRRATRQRPRNQFAPAGIDDRRPAVVLRQRRKRCRVIVLRDDEQSCAVGNGPHSGPA